MERSRRPVHDQWLHRQFFQHICGGQIPDHEVSGRLGFDGARLSTCFTQSQPQSTMDPREQNAEADDLSKERFDRFDPAKRIEVDLDEIGFKVIPRLAEVAGQLDEEIRLRKTSKKEELPRRRHLRKRS